jgi:hypothetical protein
MTEEVIKYVDGELEGESKRNFESRLLQDVNLKAELDAVIAAKKLSEGIIEAEIYGYLRSANKSSNSIDKAPISIKSNKKSAKIISIALLAACSLLFVFVQLSKKLTDESVVKDSYAMYYNPPIWPAERNATMDSTILLLAKYDNGDKSVIPQLITIDSNDKNYFEKKYWAAEVLLKEKRMADASSIADELIKAKVYTSRSHYIKVMDLLCNKSKEAAIQYIHSIPSSEIELDEKKFFKKLQQ